VVPLLPLPVCAARRPIYHALAEAEGILKLSISEMARQIAGHFLCGV
jgi:hypothetical protein